MRTTRKPAPMGGVAARPTPQPVMVRPPRPLRPRPVPVRRTRGGRWIGVAAMLALAVTAFATQEIWRPMLPGADGSARAADIDDAALPIVPEAPAVKIKAFADPRDYLILPAGGGLSVPLRRGPGDDFPLVDSLSMHDAVIGRGTATDANGTVWVLVSRASDGLAGFVHQTALLERTEPGALDAPPPPRPESAQVAAGKAAVVQRFNQLLAGSTPLDRAYLGDGQKLWEAQRLRCADDPNPDLCRGTLDAQRRGDLESWHDAGVAAQRSAANPALNSASLDKLH
jgi:hypothetical protein